MKKLFILLVIFLQINNLNGQTGYLYLNIVDENDEFSSFQAEIKNINQPNVETLTYLQFIEKTYELPIGQYQIKVRGFDEHIIKFNFFIFNGNASGNFQIKENDTTSLFLKMDFDTIYSKKKYYIEALDLKGEFYCQRLDCLDKEGKKNGIIYGRYGGMDETGNSTDVYVDGKLILAIYAENGKSTYCYNQLDKKPTKINIADFQMNNDQVVKFVKENFKNGQLKKPLIYKKKVLKKN